MDGIKYTGEQIMAYGNEATYKGYVKVCFDSAAEFATPKLTTVISDGQSIERNGGKNVGSISGKTSFVLAGDNMGPSKLQKAEKLGVEIMDEDRFLEMINSASASLPKATPKAECLPEEAPRKKPNEQLSLF